MSKPELMSSCRTNANTARDLHEMTCDIIEKAYAEYGSSPPFWVIGIPGGYVAIATPWASDSEQMASRDVIGALLKVFRAHAYTFFCECTMVHIAATTEEEVQAIRNTMPDRLEHLPREQREDTAMIVTQPKLGEQTMTRYLVNNNGDYKPFLGLRVDETEKKPASGRMTNLFALPLNDSEVLRRMIARFKESMKHAL